MATNKRRKLDISEPPKSESNNEKGTIFAYSYHD